MDEAVPLVHEVPNAHIVRLASPGPRGPEQRLASLGQYLYRFVALFNQENVQREPRLRRWRLSERHGS